METLAENTYNEIGQLAQKKVGNNLQTIDYSYNIRGWLTGINNPNNLGSSLFDLTLRYENPANTATAPKRYNGNISESEWKTNYTGSDGILRQYGYQHDGLNRLTKAKFVAPNQGWDSFYDENLNYDLNGNITGLERFSKPHPGVPIAERIDNLSYTYTGNQVTRITDAANNTSGYPGGGGAITYDANGNMLKMPDKGISAITYNFLNLPQIIVGPMSMTGENENTTYIYRADGVKQNKRYYFTARVSYRDASGIGYSDFVQEVRTTEYWSGFQYSYEGYSVSPVGEDAPAPILQFVPTAEGYYDFVKNRYIYNYVDQLGNVRLSYYRNSAGGLTVLEENNYYPFGLKHEGYNSLHGNSNYQYKYNGKELQETGMYDYGARFYMPEIGRWGVVDPLTEETFELYSYVSNNPIRFNDPDGKEGADMIDKCPPNCPEGVTEIRPLANNESETTIEEVVINGQMKTSSVGAPSTGESLIPIWGSGRAAINDFQTGHWGWGIFDSAMTISDIFLLKSLVVSVGKLGAIGIGKLVTEDVAKGVTAPKGWITRASKKGGGTVFKDPSNPHNIIRQMPGNPNSPNVLQQNPYVKFMKDGKFYDVNGKVLPNGNVPGAHIPLNQFDISKMPKF